MRESSIGYIIDIYSPFGHNDNVVYIFKLHNADFCIRKIKEFQWGQPILQNNLIEEEQFNNYYVYNTLEEALTYIRRLKGLTYEECFN